MLGAEHAVYPDGDLLGFGAEIFSRMADPSKPVSKGATGSSRVPDWCNDARALHERDRRSQKISLGTESGSTSAAGSDLGRGPDVQPAVAADLVAAEASA